MITNPAAVCAPATVDLTAAAVTAGSTAGLTYTYFTDAAGTIALATPTAVATSGTYYIIGTLAAGCASAPMPVVVTIGPAPTVVITNPAAVCAPATVDLTAAAVTAGSTAGLTYTYFTDAAGTIALATPECGCNQRNILYCWNTRCRLRICSDAGCRYHWHSTNCCDH